jgi:4-hydroxy-3-methylbut-2-enyl diphosphate reductase
MKVKLSKKHGFCFGVKKAIDCVLKLEGEVNTLGPLIHNPQFVKELAEKGIKPVSSIDEINSKTVIIRTHGIPDKIIDELNKRNINIINLTCPFVKTVQNHAKELEKQGYKVIIIGEKGHPEVEAIKSNLKDAIIIENIEEAKAIKNYEKIGIVAQTTQKVEYFLNIAEELKKHTKETKLINTICNATQERQEAALELAKEVDIMIVIGGYNSANTKQLTKLCEAIVETKHIETEDDLNKSWFKDKNIVGITAGASTPDSIIKKVKERLSFIKKD